MTALHDVALIDISELYLYILPSFYIYIFIYIYTVYCILAVCGVQYNDAFLGWYLLYIM